MSDRPNDSTNDEPENSGWRAPSSSGGWRTPQESQAPGERNAWRVPAEPEAAEQVEGWRVPSLPRDLGTAPGKSGGWHLPKPQDTIYTPEDESVVAPPAEQALAVTDTAETVEAEGETTTPEIIPFEDTTPESLPTVELLDEDDDEDSFSMSELVALASLVDNAPLVEVEPAVATSEIPAVPQEALDDDSTGQPAGTDAQPLDPAEYARQQVERLQQGQVQVDDASAQVEAAPDEGVLSPEEYARRELERLNAAQAADAPAVESAVAAPAQPVEANRFREAEEKIRALRQRYQSGEITRDALQEELRRAMVLDEDNIWWMMGVESDRWYKHQGGTWVPATPPGLEAGTDTGDEGDRTVPTSPIDEGWIPRAVPVQDPDYTVPGRGGIFLDADQEIGMTADTVPMATHLDATVPIGVTVPSRATQYDAVEGALPSAADQPPDYEVQEASETYEDAVARQRSRLLRTVAVLAAISAALLFIIGAVVAIGIVVYYNSLASPWRGAIENLANYQPQFRTVRILAADGSLIAELTSREGGARDEIALSDVSPEMVHALVSIENERYFEDPGFDPVAIGRAFLQNLSSGEVTSGASTITQQVARNLILQDTTVSAERKLQEIVVAAEIARRYDKNFILELYLNEFFFGNQSYGIEAASQFYFGHGADSLNLAESALLAGILQAPARYDPVINRNDAFARMNVVLNQMAEVGCLQFSFAPYNQQPFCVTQADIDPLNPRFGFQLAQVESRTYNPRSFTVRYPHFVNFVQQQIENSFGTSEMFQRGFEIKTTLMPRLQDVAQNALVQQVNALATNGVNTGAVMVIDPRDGAIRAMVGSPDFSDDTINGQVNNAFTWQQSGSAIKPILYTAALEGVDRNGTRDYFTPATVLWDVPTSFENPAYTPINYDRTFHGPVSVRLALGSSYNVPAVKTLNFIGINKFLDTAQRMGLRFLPENSPSGLASALGANEVRLYDMMQAYGVIANDGMRVGSYAITEIQDADGNLIVLPERAQPAQAVQPQVAFLIQSILSDNAARTPAFGANSPLVIPGYDGRVAVKTGTTNDSRDLWTMGFSSNTVVGVWIGRVDNNPTVNTSGLAAAPIWNAVMTAALQGTNPEPFNPPQGVVQQQVCADTGTIYDAGTGCTAVRNEYFVQNSPPPAAGQGFVITVPVDTWTGLRANQFCTESVVTQTFANINDAAAVAWLNSTGQAYAASIGLTVPIRPAPSTECTPSTVLPQVRFSAPSNGAQVSGAVQISGVATGPNFQRYQLELAPASAPENFQPIAGPFNNEANGTLATWDSTVVPNGAYKLRLAAFASDGGYRYDTIDIGVNNIIPTEPPPTLPPPVIPTDDFGNATPIPPQGFPTPTIFLGG